MSRKLVRSGFFPGLSDEDFNPFFSARSWPAHIRKMFDALPEDFMEDSWQPPVDIRETEKQYLVTVDVPGVDPDAIDVSYENGALTISGHRESEERSEKNGYRRVERFEGEFFRRFTLPEAVDKDRIKARTVKGVLSVEIPKATRTEAKHIPVTME